MSSYTGISPKGPNHYVGPNVYLPSIVTRMRQPTGADYRQPETGKLYPTGSFWLVAKNPTTGVEGELWYLSKIVANVAFWVKVGLSPSGPILGVVVDSTSLTGTNPVYADVTSGLIGINGGQIAAASTNNVIKTNSFAPSVFSIQIQRSTTAASTNANVNGVSHFSSNDFSVDSNGYVQAKNSSSVVGVRNIGFSYNAGTGTFTVEGQDGNALSASNPGYVTLQDRSDPGRLVTIPVTANQSFIDDNGASQIIGNLFGLTTGVATSVDVPFFLYAVANDNEDTISFMISRYPNIGISPIAAKIGTPSSAVASTQGSFFAFTNITVANYDLNPCYCIGSFRMRMSAADDWTVQSLIFIDGIGRFQQGIQFAFPRGQFGAAAGKAFKDNGGTAPNDAGGGYTYYIDQYNNRIFYQVAFPSLDTAGVGAVTATLALPFTRLEGATSGSGFLNNGGTYSSLTGSTNPSTNNLTFIFVNPAASGVALNTNFGVADGFAFNGTIAIEFS